MLLFAPRPQSFMIYKAERYDVKGRKYIGPPMKYYFSDMGLGNARLNFRQREVELRLSGHSLNGENDSGDGGELLFQAG